MWDVVECKGGSFMDRQNRTITDIFINKALKSIRLNKYKEYEVFFFVIVIVVQSWLYWTRKAFIASGEISVWEMKWIIREIKGNLLIYNSFLCLYTGKSISMKAIIAFMHFRVRVEVGVSGTDTSLLHAKLRFCTHAIR